MGWTNNLLRGIAQHLHDAGVGVYKPNDAYAAGDIAIVIGDVPPAPDKVIVLQDYTPDGQNQGGDVAEQVQARCRGDKNDPGSVKDIRDGVRDALDGLAWVHLGGVAVQQIFLSSGTTLGKDGNDRTETTSNFTVQARRTTPLRTE